MIKIENITIKFDKILFEESSILIPSGKITCILGKSGEGKSTLLSVIGLLQINKDISYCFDNHKLVKVEKELATFRREKIGYVFQDNSLIEHMTIYENMKLVCSIRNLELSESKAEAILKKIGLRKKLNTPVTMLSGGEKQRLAIGCALSKEPRLLILDEPTSSLDDYNTMLILKILEDLTKSGMMIVLATHDSRVIPHCDLVYEISNQKLKCNFDVFCDQQNDMPLTYTKIRYKFYFYYYYIYLKHKFWIFMVMFFICGITISGLVGINSISKGYEKKQLEYLDALGNTEIFVTSKKDDKGEAKYTEFLPEIDKTIYQRIENNIHCDKIYDFYEVHNNEIMVNKEKMSINYTIQPYTPEQRIMDHLKIRLNDNTDIFISAQLATEININEANNSKISLNIKFPDSSIVSFENLEISGILNDDYSNVYTDSQKVVYIPIENFPTQNNNQALLVYASHFDKTNSLRQDIININSELGVYNRFTRVQDIQTLFERFISYINMIIYVFLIICFMFLYITFTRYILNRKKEILLLKTNGLSVHNIFELIIYELGCHTLLMTSISSVCLVSLYMVFANVIKIPIYVNLLSDILIIGIISFAFMLVPSIISLIVFQKNSIAEELRNTIT